MLTSEDRHRPGDLWWLPGQPARTLGSWSYRHRRLVAVAWIVVLVAISVAGRLAGSSFKDNLNGGTSTPPSKRPRS